MDGPSPKKKAKATVLPVCPYGSRCYRKNPQHFKEFSHADDDNKSSSSKQKDALPLADSTPLPVCKYGANCYRKNLLHFAEFSHPTAVTSTDMTDSGNDTDPVSDDDTDDKKKSPKKKVKDVDILKRGVSLVKNYSQMSEEERKELIKKAMAAKKQLEEELQATKNEVKKKDEELNRLQKEVAGGALLMEGEKEAMEGNKVVYFDLFPERSYKEGSAAQTHFRLAESQFYRLISGSGNNYTVTKVQYAVNPPLVKQFHESMDDLKKQRGEELSFPVLAFHGTEQKNIKPIVENNFKVPGEKGFTHRTDTGWYGKGVYFSEYPSYSMGYISGASQLLLCQVLPGKVFHCTNLIHGAEMKKGYDSHMSPDKKELVVFNCHHIIPAYIVHYKDSKGDFKYKAPTGKGTSKGGTSSNKASSDDNQPPDDICDETKLAEKGFLALSAKTTKVFKGQQITFSGIFQHTQAEMYQLVEKHGAKKGTAASFSFLIASLDEYSNGSSKCAQANKKNVPILGEMFVYDCILKKKMLDQDDYNMDILC
ncbi:uncharacterized protein [Mytilus edulis]|uniref:uncharacterized protein n=1 Tax=Mytilus edulis TaxID=6550 RepID=UPI0039EE33CD